MTDTSNLPELPNNDEIRQILLDALTVVQTLPQGEVTALIVLLCETISAQRVEIIRLGEILEGRGVNDESLKKLSEHFLAGFDDARERQR